MLTQNQIEAADLTVEISDDGSLDTVIVVNGSEYRFTYDPEGWIDSGEEGEISEEAETQAYDAFIEWAESAAVEEYLSDQELEAAEAEKAKQAEAWQAEVEATFAESQAAKAKAAKAWQAEFEAAANTA